MLKQPVTYTDFNGNPRTEDLYFNLTEAELIELQVGSNEGIQKDLENALAKEDISEILAFIKMLVSKSYGVKSEDGRHFRKSDQIRDDFESSALYSDFLLGLFSDEGAAGLAFIQGVMPTDLIKRAEAQMKVNESVAQSQPVIENLNDVDDLNRAMPEEAPLSRAEYNAWLASQNPQV